MEQRKVIPIIKTEFRNLNGITIVNEEKVNIYGDIFLKDSSPCFLGNGCLPRTIDSVPELTLHLKDAEGHEIVCNNCMVVNSFPNKNGQVDFEAKILKLTIQKGKIDKEDEVEIFSALRINNFSGEEFDQDGHRCVNILEFVSKNARLYSVPISDISNCNGHLYFPTKMSEFNNYGEKLIDKLCSLLSFVSVNFVDSPYHVLLKNHENYMIQIYPGKFSKFSNKGDGIFRIDSLGIVQNYLKSAWIAWDNYIDKIDLPSLIDYYVFMKNQEFIETKILVGCVWMEAIKYEYASNVAKYQKDKWKYFLKPKSSTRFKFEELVQEVYNYFKINNGDLSFVNYRNEIVHQGRIYLPFEDKFNLCDQLICSIESIMLKILNYKGRIWDRFKRDYVEFP
ncbi:MAG: hypothetical protein Q7J76_07415 [Candidatus Brocadiaceae bacterium]|uniref:hypothetical protein n=1 Tax=Candidatus Wunengus sp. YC61 TaxID=3367698 RepID=UPI0027184799|nr:hypothetical protein [Candidatus Brocadiaceae bacterium]